MKKSFLIFLAIVCALLTSCKTYKDVLYLQDVTSDSTLAQNAVKALTFQPGDKFSVVVNSAATPELAIRYNLAIVSMQAGSTSASGNQMTAYTVGEDGMVEIPGIGTFNAIGKTRVQLRNEIQSRLREGQINDAVVTINCLSRYVTVLGEVKTPGRVLIEKDNITLLEALGAVGDLNIQARRDNIIVIRNENGEQKSYIVDLRSKNFISSPIYNLQQNDVVYVQPNKSRIGQSTTNGNSVRQISTWLSVSSVLISLAILIFRK